MKIGNKETDDLLKFKELAEERLEKAKINDSVLEKCIQTTDKRVAAFQSQMDEMEEYLKTSSAATGGLNKEEFIRLLASKAEKDIEEK